MNNGFEKLEKNICDSVREAQIKIGYEKGSISLFYPAESIVALLRVQNDETERDAGIKRASFEEVYAKLEGFTAYCRERLGDITITNREDRFCFVIPDKGTAYINEYYVENQFLKAFLDCITKAGCKAEDVIKVFTDFSKEHTIEYNPELGMVIYFNDIAIDEYIYCIRFDEFGATYHRFSRQDFNELINSPK